jgi:adenine-specific DNA-methyltransferase
MDLLRFSEPNNFLPALKAFFEDLKVPVNYVSDLPATAKEILINSYKENETFKAINDVYFLGIVDDAAFDKQKSIDTKQIKSDYDGILIFGIELQQRDKDLLPPRSQLADIARAFNREFYYTPVVVVFKYGNHIAFANTERIQYKQEWREGEKVGKVTLLRDIDLNNVHEGHRRILKNLEISRNGKSAINDFNTLYKYWQEVLSVSILNKVFYKELSNWYFWAIKEVRFPNEPLQLDFDSIDKYDEAIKEHNGKNVIRLLTRLLFIWFIKEKGLIPEEIFDEKEIANRFIDGFTPQKPEGMFVSGKNSSKYYRAILQNLFFATLNQPRGDREFRGDGKHLNATQLMRYQSYLKEPDYFIELMESKVPFMNGGLFECLDKPHPTLKGAQGGDRIIYVDGFSDRSDNELLVPDFLFFDTDELVDLSKDYGNSKAKNEKTRGLFNILKSYKFTITENTPIDEDVALDPELLGKVFENLLASYNPETKTTARKQTGSFYTPREIVNYMVEESLIAYLKNSLLHEDAGIAELGKAQIKFFGNETKKTQLDLETKLDESPFKGKEEDLENMLHQLVSFSTQNPFEGNASTQKQIIKALDTCKILDPACGSGAYPMGILQKMVHILDKIDPNNTEWKQRQIERVNEAIESLELVEDAEYKNRAIKELKAQIADIESAFENNELDYGRKLFLIENCIYGVDIQPIATQISKLRFFISLVVDQKVDPSKENFGIRPLPNLETKFVAANTLIGLPNGIQGSLFDKREVKKLEDELKKVRHKLFSVKTPSIKRELRAKDKALREEMQTALAEQLGNETAQLLAQWDPYDQNTSSPFFDKEWMFDVSKGFDVVIGNPPYVNVEKIDKIIKDNISLFKTAYQKYDLYVLFYEKSLIFLKNGGILNFITSNKFLSQGYGLKLRQLFLENKIIEIVNFNYDVFETATVRTCIFHIQKEKTNDSILKIIDVNDKNDNLKFKNKEYQFLKQKIFENTDQNNFRINLTVEKVVLLKKIESDTLRIDDICSVNYGLRPVSLIEGDDKFSFIKENYQLGYKKYFEGKDTGYWTIDGYRYLDYKKDEIYNPMFEELFENNKLAGLCTLSEINKLRFVYDDEGFYCNHSLAILTLWYLLENVNNITINRTISIKKINISKSYSYKFLQSILNSKMIKFYVNELLYDGTHFYPNHMKQLPIKVTSISVQQPFISHVNQIIAVKKIGQDTSSLEHQIDVMVYHLYDLTYEEACVIDNKLSKEDFELYKIN